MLNFKYPQRTAYAYGSGLIPCYNRNQRATGACRTPDDLVQLYRIPFEALPASPIPQPPRGSARNRSGTVHFSSAPKSPIPWLHRQSQQLVPCYSEIEYSRRPYPNVTGVGTLVRQSKLARSCFQQYLHRRNRAKDVSTEGMLAAESNTWLWLDSERAQSRICSQDCGVVYGTAWPADTPSRFEHLFLYCCRSPIFRSWT